MKILTVTDIHGAYQKVVEMVNKEKPDLLIIGGDLTTYGTVTDVQKGLNLFKQVSDNFYCISGNMDAKEHDDYYKQSGISINGIGKIIKDIGIFGVSAAPISPLRTPYEIPEELMESILQSGFRDVLSARVKILISHAPPYDTAVDLIRSGKHVGSKAVRKFIEKEKPDVAVCGHIHEARGKDNLGPTKIINCGEGSGGYYGIITIEDKIINVQNMSL